jgi:hypothetical protein
LGYLVSCTKKNLATLVPCTNVTRLMKPDSARNLLGSAFKCGIVTWTS